MISRSIKFVWIATLGTLATIHLIGIGSLSGRKNENLNKNESSLKKSTDTIHVYYSDINFSPPWHAEIILKDKQHSNEGYIFWENDTFCKFLSNLPLVDNQTGYKRHISDTMENAILSWIEINGNHRIELKENKSFNSSSIYYYFIGYINPKKQKENLIIEFYYKLKELVLLDNIAKEKRAQLNYYSNETTINDLKSIFWEFKSAKLHEASFKALDSLAGYINSHQQDLDTIEILVEETYLSIESAYYSKRRAETIKEYLLKAGVMDKAIITEGRVKIVEEKNDLAPTIVKVSYR